MARLDPSLRSQFLKQKCKTPDHLTLAEIRDFNGYDATYFWSFACRAG